MSRLRIAAWVLLVASMVTVLLPLLRPSPPFRRKIAASARLLIMGMITLMVLGRRVAVLGVLVRNMLVGMGMCRGWGVVVEGGGG